MIVYSVYYYYRLLNHRVQFIQLFYHRLMRIHRLLTLVRYRLPHVLFHLDQQIAVRPILLIFRWMTKNPVMFRLRNTTKSNRTTKWVAHFYGRWHYFSWFLDMRSSVEEPMSLLNLIFEKSSSWLVNGTPYWMRVRKPVVKHKRQLRPVIGSKIKTKIRPLITL